MLDVSFFFFSCAEGETLLSPVVMCGPVGMELQKPVIISFQHCASLQHGHWNISVLSSSDLEMPDPSSWKVLYLTFHYLLIVTQLEKE
jgi:leucine-rich repeat transmembrane protein FLRT